MSSRGPSDSEVKQRPSDKPVDPKPGLLAVPRDGRQPSGPESAKLLKVVNGRQLPMGNIGLASTRDGTTVRVQASGPSTRF
jgi:hypothetical protein